MTQQVYLSEGFGASGDNAVDLLADADFYIRQRGINIGAVNEQEQIRQIRCRMIVQGTSGDDVATNYRSMVKLVNNILSNAGPWGRGKPVTLSMNLFDTTDPIYWVVLNGRIQPGTIYEDFMEVDLLFIVDAYALGTQANIAESSDISVETGYYMVNDIPGDVDAYCSIKLKDTSTGSQINRFRLGRMSQEAMVSTDFEPIQDLTPSGGASTGSDPDNINDNDAFRTLTAGSPSWLTFGNVTMPDKALHHGLFDIFARIDDDASPPGAPTAPTVTIKDGFVTGTNVMSIIQSNEREDLSPGTSETISWDQATGAGNFLMLYVATWDTADTGVNIPSGWTEIFQVTEQHATNSFWTCHALFIIEDAAPRSGNETLTWTSSTPDEVHLVVIEIENVVASGGVLTSVSGSKDIDVDPTDMDLMQITTADKFTMLWSFYTYADDNARWLENNEQVPWERLLWNAGYMAAIHYWRQTAAGTFESELRASPTLTGRRALQAGIALKQSEDVTNPGFLKAGTYTFYAVAVDSTGNISLESAGTGKTFVNDGGKATITITGGTGDIQYYRVYFQNPDGDYYYVATLDTTTPLELTTEEGAILVPDLSWAAVATPNLYRLNIGTENGDVYPLPPVAGLGTIYKLTYMGTAALPPVPRQYDNTRHRGFVVVEGRAGGGPSSAPNIDALWLFPHNEPSAIIEKPGHDLQTQRTFFIDTAVDGAISGSLLDTTTEAIQGQAVVTGAMLLAPGDNMLIIAAEVYDALGLESVLTSVQFTVEIDYTPRFDIVAGDY